MNDLLNNIKLILSFNFMTVSTISALNNENDNENQNTEDRINAGSS